MDRRNIGLLAIAVIVGGLALWAFTSASGPSPPDVDFVTTQIDKNSIKVGETARISVNAIDNDDKPYSNVKVVTTAEGGLSDTLLTITPSELELDPLTGLGSSTKVEYVTVTANDVGGLSTPFKIRIVLLIDEIETDRHEFDLTIIK